jgi:hypothetical protein
MARPLDSLIRELDGGGGDGGGGSFTTPAPSSVAPAPALNPGAVSGGATPATDPKITEFASEEGGSLPIAYGEHLVAGSLVFHNFIAGTPNQSTFVVALGDGQGDGGGHGEWDSVVEAWYAGEPIVNGFPFRIWMEDDVPEGATLFPADDGWNWITDNPKPYSGRRAHQSILQAGVHQHYFETATDTLAVGTGDVLSCFVFVDAANPPTEVMLQFQAGGNFEHRAYWGANSIALGTNGTNSRRQISASVPTPGQWVRLDIPASQVGLEGLSVTGIAFTLFGGKATFDQVSRWHPLVTPGYVFRPGVIPTDLGSIEHSHVSIGGLAHSGTANILVVLSAAQAAEDRPDKFRGRFRCRRVFDFDASGNEIFYGYGLPGTNPANVSADRVLAYFEHLYPDDLELAREKFRARIDWPTWRAWADYNHQTIPWNRYGDGDVFILRFEAHVAFTTDIILADALDRICAMSGAWWQDEGEKLIFLPPTDRDPVHHFDASNILVAPRLIPRDLRERPNRFIAKLRELADPYLGEVTVEVRRDDLIRRVGEIKSEAVLSPMHQSQGQRLLERQARIECDNPNFLPLVGDETSLHVLPGDFVTVTHPSLNWEYQRCLVIDIELRSAEDSVDEVAFTLQQINGPLYSDTSHTSIQEQLLP